MSQSPSDDVKTAKSLHLPYAEFGLQLANPSTIVSEVPKSSLYGLTGFDKPVF